jgi:hypothetical protein
MPTCEAPVGTSRRASEPGSTMQTTGRGSEGWMFGVPLALIALFVAYTNGGVLSLLETIEVRLRGFFVTIGETVAALFR